MNKETTMKLRLAQGLAARGLGRVWMMVLLLVGLAAQSTLAAGSYYTTSGIDIKQFSPSKELNKYWMYLDSTLKSGTGWSSATSGLIGIGSDVYANASQDTFKVPTYIGGALSGGANVYFDTLVHIEGNASFGNSSKIGINGGASQFDKDVSFANNGGRAYSDVWVGGNLTTNGNSIYDKSLYIRGSVTNSSTYNGNVYFGGTQAASGDVSSIPVAQRFFNQAYSAPLGPMIKYDSSQLPAYKLTELATATARGKGTLTDIWNASFNTDICPLVAGGACTDVLSHTINGVTLNAGKILPPGYYGNLTVDNMTFYLGEGVYYFNKVNLNNADAKLIALQPKGGRTIVYADSGFRTSAGGIFVGPDSAVGATKYGSGPGLFMGGTMMIAGGPHATIRFDSDIKIWATLSTPTGTISVNSGLTLFGQMFARHFEGANQFKGGNGEFVPFDPDIPEINISISPAGTTVPEDDKVYTANISLSHKNAYAVSFKYATAISVTTATGAVVGTAVPDVNFKSRPDSVVIIKAGDTLVTIPFTIKWDKVFTGNTTFYLNFTEPAGGKFGVGTGVVGDSSHVAALITIVDKDRAPAFQISDVTLKEGNSGPTEFKFVVSFADSATGKTYGGTVGRDLTFKWSTKDGTAHAPSDYVAEPIQTATIAKGSTSTTLTVKVNGDLRYEPDETFSVVLDSVSLIGQSALVGAAQKKLVGLGTILNDDDLPRLAMDIARIPEGDADSVRKLVVYLTDATGKKLDKSSAPELDVSYNWLLDDIPATISGPATATVADNDYVKVPWASGKILAGALTDTIQFTTKGDLRYEPDEAFKVVLIPGDNVYHFPSGSWVDTVVLLNDDNQPIVSVTVDSSKGYHEGNSGDRHVATFTVRLLSQKDRHLLTAAELPSTQVSFDWKTQDGTAIGKVAGSSDSDYYAVSGAHKVIAAGKSSDTLQVVIIGDKRFENPENFGIQLYHLANAAPFGMNDTTAPAIILNDDSLPRLKVVASNSPVTEGNSGTVDATFKVTLTDPAGVDLLPADAPEVDVPYTWNTVDGTAKHNGAGVAETDYVRVDTKSEMLTAGTLSQILTVKVNGDVVDEDDEQFSVHLIPGATGVSPNGILSTYATIADDDALPVLTLAGVKDNEGNVSVKDFGFTATLSGVSARNVTFDWGTVDGTATLADNDYLQVVAGTGKVTIKAGLTTYTLNVPVKGDKRLENDETFSIKATNLVGATFAASKDTAVGTILNDDDKPFIQLTSLGNVYEKNPGDSPLDTLLFKVSLVDSSGKPASPSALDVTYTWSTVDSAGLDGARATDNDLVAQASVARTINAGSLYDTLRVPVIPDTKYENNESFRVVLKNVVGADTNGVKANAYDQGITMAIGTILNDDALPQLRVRDTLVQEPELPTAPDSLLVFTVRLSQASGVPVTVSFSTQGGTAKPYDIANKENYDYRDTSGTLSFAPGEVSKTVSVKVHGDNLFEGTVPETMLLVLQSLTGASVSPDSGTATGRIKDNDDAPILRIDSVTASEGTPAVFTASLRDKSGSLITSSLQVDFTWKTIAGTATADLDFKDTTGVGTIVAGNNSVQLQVRTLPDNIANEGFETFLVAPVTVTNATLSDSGLGRIKDLTPTPQVSIKDTIVSEGAGHAVFVITLDRPSATDLKLTWNTADDADRSALLQARASGSDSNYTPKINVLVTFPKNTVTDTVWVPINDNSQDEPDTLWYWSLLKKATAGDATFAFKDSLAEGGIVDNDAPPTISVNDVSVQEPKDASSAKGYAKFTISLSAKSAQDISVSWKTVDSTAKHDSDFVTKSGTALIKAGSLSVVDSIQILPDTLWELAEHFKISLFSPVSAKFSDSLGVITIRDNDVAPAVRIDDAEITEPNNLPDSTLITFKVRLSHVSGRSVLFKWETADNWDVPAGNQAIVDADYRVVAPTTVTMLPGDSVASLKVWVLSDNISEQKEKFKILLSKSVADDTNLTFADPVGVGAINDANGRPFVSLNDTSMVEANAAMRFRLKLTNPSSTDVKVYVHSLDQTATGSSDYEKLPASGVDTVITIKAGKDTATFQVRILDDLLHENTETFKLVIDSTDTLTDGSMLPSANIGGVGYGIGTILDNDSAPKVSVIDSSLQEPAVAGASAMMKFRIHLSAPSELPVSVAWSTLDSTAQTKIAPYDYVDTGSSLTLRPGLVDTTISVRILGDSLYEGSESFKLNLSTVTGGSFADSSAVGTILDNDVAPGISIDDRMVREGDTARFTVRLERVSGIPVTFLWNTLDGTAKVAFKDYKDSSGSVTIPAGSRTAILAVRTLADNVSGEGAETFRVALTGIVGATIGRDTGTGTILDDNSLPRLTIDTILHIHEADTVVHFTVKLRGPVSAVPVHVHYATHAVTATPGLRYADTSGTVSIAAGDTSASIAVRILDDNIREPVEEYFTVVLDAADSAVLYQPIGLGGVLDDSDLPTLKVGNSGRTFEGDNAFFPFQLIGLSKDTIRAWWHTVDSTAKKGLDYRLDSGVVTFLPGNNSGSVFISTLLDNVWESDEFFRIVIDSVRPPVGNGVGSYDTSAVGTVVDVGGIPNLRFLSPDTTVLEDRSGEVPVRVGLSRPASVDIVALILPAAGTAIMGTDYTVSGLVMDTLVIKAGDTVATFKVHVVKDSTDEYDETAVWTLQPVAPVKLGAKSRYELTIQDDDSAPLVRVARDTQSVTEGDSTVVAFKLSRKSAKEITAWYVTTGTATPGTDDDRVGGVRTAILFPAGKDSAFAVLHTREDRIYERTETAVFALDGATNAGLDSLHRIDTVRILDNDGVPTVRFTKTDTTVPENVGAVTFTLTLSNPSAFVTHVSLRAKAGSATLDSTARVSDAVLDTLATYPVTFAAGDTVATFSLRILDDGRVEPVENFFLKLSSTEAIPGDSAQVKIQDNDVLPVVKITDPTEGEHLGKKDLNASGKVPVSWTLNTAVQMPFDTLLAEGPSTIRKCYTDDWGNTGCDSVHVILDLTAPTVKIDSISKDGKTWLPVDPNVPWVNVPGVLVAWTYVDGDKRVSKIDSAKLTDTLNTPTRCVEDAVGNKGCDTASIGFDNVPPVVSILTPPSWSHWSAGNIGVIWTEQDGTAITRHDDFVHPTRVGPYVITECSKPDRAGNIGCASDTIYIDPNVPNGATFVDTDHDGKIDAVIVQFPRNWTDPLPTFDISYASPGANALKGQTATYGTSSQNGTSLVYNGETIRVVEGTPVLDAKGNQVIDASGAPVFHSSVGTPLLDAKGKPVTDANGVPLWKLTTSGSTVDSSVLVIKLTTPYPYGWTSSTVTDLGVLKGEIGVVDLAGKQTKQTLFDTFDIKDGVPPVILGSTIIRTEDYKGKDTLVIQLSETADLGKRSGTGIFEISTDEGKTWKAVDVLEVTATGELRIPLEPGAPGTPRPGTLIRIAGNVTDASGNVATSSTSPAVVVKGGPRPDLVKVTGPTTLLEITEADGKRDLGGPMAFLATRSGTNDTAAYQPGVGYVGNAAVTSVCPDARLCATTTLYINRASSVQMIVYDQLGTFVAKTSFFVTKKDLEMIEKDKLDRARLQIVWNLRDMQNRQVSTGVYLVRMLVRFDDDTRPDARMQNYILRYGVKVR